MKKKKKSQTLSLIPRKMESKEKVEKQIEEICEQIDKIKAQGSENLRLLERLCKEKDRLVALYNYLNK
nr:MAG TPA: PRKC APOPTOSIS WT1 REGULATOR PROTEIN [Caudoviricetes sp.]